LRQLLNTGKDFVVVGFEGNVTRPVGERRIKRSVLCDVADMVHSFHYAAWATLFDLSSPQGRAPGVVRVEDRPDLERWARAWFGRVAQEFVAAYTARMEGTGVLPDTTKARRILLAAYLQERALRDIEDELRWRRDWVGVPLAAALQLIGTEV